MGASLARSMSFIRFPWRKKSTPEEEPAFEQAEQIADEADKRKIVMGHDGNLTTETLNYLARKKKLLTNRNAYKPPEDLEERIRNVVEQTVGTADQDWHEISLKESRLKYKVLTAMIHEFRHDIPCATLSDMKTIGDALEYFQKEVRISAPLEDMSKIPLPPNLNIQLEAIRYDKNRDTMFGGITAYPGQDTYVESIKFKRKYNTIKNTTEKGGYVNHYYDY